MPETCNWQPIDDSEFWGTECGELVEFIQDGPKENKFNYCPFCGREIREAEERGES